MKAVRAGFFTGLCAVFAVVLAACGDDNESAPATSSSPSASSTVASATFAPGETKAPTAAAPATSEGPAAPTPVMPQLSSGVRRIGEGTMNFTLVPNVNTTFDPSTFPLEQPNEKPPCSAFVFAFGWQVTNPYPAPTDLALVWRRTSEGQTVEVARGPAGEQNVGCGLLEAFNAGTSDVSVSVHYIIGSAGG